MKRFYAKSAMVAMAVLAGWTLLTPAQAAPPTVTPSPGYRDTMRACSNNGLP
jgi:hypothetical protein